MDHLADTVYDDAAVSSPAETRDHESRPWVMHLLVRFTVQKGDGLLENQRPLSDVTAAVWRDRGRLNAAAAHTHRKLGFPVNDCGDEKGMPEDRSNYAEEIRIPRAIYRGMVDRYVFLTANKLHFFTTFSVCSYEQAPLV